MKPKPRRKVTKAWGIYNSRHQEFGVLYDEHQFQIFSTYEDAKAQREFVNDIVVQVEIREARKRK